MREIIFDTETTGFKALQGDRMVEIGCIELVNRTETGNTFHSYFNPERDMPIEAENVHGLSVQFLSDKPLFGDRAAELLEFLGDAHLVAHNAAFDFSFLNAELARVKRPAISLDRMIDTVAMARKLHPGAKHTLDALCVRYGIDRSHRIKHGALLDAELLTHLYIEMTGGRQIGLGLAADSLPDAADTARMPKSAARSAAYREPRPHSASDAELERHALFIRQLTQPLWLDTV